MKIKRLLTSVTAQFDDFVNKVENHEAVAESAIRSARQQTAKIHTQLRITQKRLQDLETRHQTLQQQTELWKQRAVVSNAENKDKALRCVQAMQNTQSEADQVLHQIKETSLLLAELQKHLTAAEQQLLELQTRKESLAARSARNTVKKYADTVADDSDLNGVFERWEQNLAADEYVSNTHYSSEYMLDHEFKQTEQQQDLEQALQQILQADASEEKHNEQH